MPDPNETTTTETTTETTTPPPEEKINKSDFDRVNAELEEHRRKAREDLASRKKQEEADLIEKQNWKTLYEREKAEKEEAKGQLSNFTESFIKQTKLSAVKEVAIRMGMADTAVEDLELIPMQGVTVEKTPSGGLKVIGADSYMASLKVSRPHWFNPGKVNLNGNTPNISPAGGIVTAKELSKLSDEARKSGDYTQYEAAMKRYQQQK